LGGLFVTHDVGSGGVAVTTEFDRDDDEAADMLLSGVADDMSDDVIDI